MPRARTVYCEQSSATGHCEAVPYSNTMRLLVQASFCLHVFTGMPESLLYCSLHDPVSPCPAGYVTNKVCYPAGLQDCSLILRISLGYWNPSLWDKFLYAFSLPEGLKWDEMVHKRVGLPKIEFKGRKISSASSLLQKNGGQKRVMCMPKKEIAGMGENSSLLVLCFICSFNKFKKSGESC